MIPKGYALYEYTDNYIVVMVTDFLLMLEDAPKYIEYDNKTYIREMIQAIPDDLLGNVCSMRKYIIRK